MHDQTHDSRGHWLWPVLLMVMIFIASGREQVASPRLPHIDKVTHVLVFGLLGTLLARALPRHRWLWAIVGASLYGAFDEFRQSFTPGRFVEWADWVCDTGGALLAVMLYTRWTAYRHCLEYRLRAPRLRFRPAAAQMKSNDTG